MTDTINHIKDQVYQVIKYSQQIPDPQVDKLIDDWFDAKSAIIQAWGGEYIVELPYEVTFTLSQEARDRRLDEFIDSIESQYENEDLAYFIDKMRSDFFNNHLSKDYIHYNNKKIPKGTKFIKAFKYFEEDSRVLTDLQNQASMLIQEDKVSGTLCMSVHPLDFLSSSENTYHWRSCHSLDGDFRSGNLSYMTDKSTIICYLRGADNVKLPNFPASVLWNNKKWRMLLFVADTGDALFAGRQYPFSSNTALSKIHELYFNMFNEDCKQWSNWHADYISAFPRKEPVARYMDEELKDRFISMNGYIFPMSAVVSDAKHSMHFNDLTHSSCYIPYYSWRRRKGWSVPGSDIPPHFTIGSAHRCLRCQQNRISLSSSMLCIDCEEDIGSSDNDNFTYCACCDRRVYRGNMIWLQSISGEICEECYNTLTRPCEQCGRSWYTCDITYDYGVQKYICPHCKGEV